MLARTAFAVFLVVSCAKPPSGTPTVDTSVPPPTAAPPSSATATLPAPTPEPSASAKPNVPTGPLALALAGRSEAFGTSWIPKRGAFLDEDLLLYPDGRYVTHLHEHPGSAGEWSLDGDVLTLHEWLGDSTFVIRSLRVRGNELRGISEDGPLTMTKHRP